jgi:proteic killer suppression protein
MDIAFSTTKLQKMFNSERELIREYGTEKSRVIIRRMAMLRAAVNLEQVHHLPPERRHELIGARKGQFAVDLKHPFRLIFTPNHQPVPRKADGGIDLQQVTAITIQSVEDYH